MEKNKALLVTQSLPRLTSDMIMLSDAYIRYVCHKVIELYCSKQSHNNSCHPLHINCYNLLQLKPNRDMSKAVDTNDRIDLQMMKKINEKRQNILFHVSMNVEKVRDT